MYTYIHLYIFVLVSYVSVSFFVSLVHYFVSYLFRYLFVSLLRRSFLLSIRDFSCFRSFLSSSFFASVLSLFLSLHLSLYFFCLYDAVLSFSLSLCLSCLSFVLSVVLSFVLYLRIVSLVPHIFSFFHAASIYLVISFLFLFSLLFR